MNRCIITIATGKQLYLDLAVTLARSFCRWHPVTDIIFKIVTDLEIPLPADLKNKVQILPVKPGELGEGFSSKLHLDKLADDGQTLFIDSDCLIFGNLEFLFDRFKGHGVSVVGGYIDKGEWFGDITAVCKKFNVPRIPKFNGGIYYMEKGNIATGVYTTARELEKQYDEIGFVRLRNRPNDEVLMSLAMQLHKQTPIDDDGMIMSDPQACPGGYKIDVINGKRWLLNPPAPNPLHQSWYPFSEVKPVIVHFLGFYTQHYPYKLNAFKLLRSANGKWNILSNIYANTVIVYPEVISNFSKSILRPIFHRVFGTRMVKQSARV